MKVKRDLFLMLQKAELLDIIDIILLRYGDKNQDYTKDEEQAMEELANMLEAEFPKEFHKWQRFAQKYVLIFVVRIFKMNNKFAVRSIKKLIILFTETFPNMLANIDVNNVKRLLDKRMVKCVKRREDEGPGIFVARIKQFDPAESSIPETIIAAALFIIKILRANPNIQRRGFVTVFDSEGFKFAHAKLAKPDLIIHALRFHGIIPHSLCKGTHIFNASILLDKTFSIFKWLLPKEIKKQLNFTKTDHSFLHKIVPMDKLPEEFQGIIPDSEAYYEHVEEELKNDDVLFDLIDRFITVFLQFNNVHKGRN